MTRHESVSLLLAAVLLMLFTTMCVNPVLAENPPANYNFLVASGYICDSTNSGTCPAVAQAANGDSIELSGAGTLNPTGKTVTAMGAYTHKNSNGEILDTGIWKATEFMKFDSYGIAPGVLIRDKRQPKSLGFSPMALLKGPLPSGGLALLRIQLMPDVGKPKEAILQVNCALGKVPENQQGDGIRLAVQGEGLKFDQKVSGRTMFILTKQQVNVPPKASDK